MQGLAPGIIQFSGRVYATLDSVRRGGSTFLSPDKLTATGSSGVGIATIGKSTGKWYWETTINSISSTSAGDYGKTGITNVLMSSPYANPTSLGGAGSAVGTVGYRGISNILQAKTNFAGSSTTIAGNNRVMVPDDVVSTTLDCLSRQLSFYLNGEIGCTITLPAGSTWYPAYQVLSGIPDSSSVTFNFGQNAWDGRTEALRSSLLGILYTIGLY